MTNSGDHLLPAVIPYETSAIEPMAKMVGLPARVVSTTLVGAEYALHRPTRGESYLISPPPYDGVIEVTYSQSGPNAPPTYWPKEDTDRFTRRHLPAGPDVLWAPDAETMSVALERRHAYEAAKAELVAEHQLGEGGLVLADAFGGINVNDPEASARHLTLRTIIAGEAGLEDINSLVEAGLVHPLLAEVVGEDLAGLMNDIGQIIKTLGMLPEAIRAQTAPLLLAGVDAQARTFIEAHHDDVMAAAFVASNPALIRKILGINDELVRKSERGFSVVGGPGNAKLIIPKTGLLDS